ncbi:DUF3718 domain-containing protein [Thalassotalea sp. HSM 43]|uniref:DUF3718 domain-containing protein n=1 Tax=Thalassotalea sp. HSM 43 TaxID=2552945 RepID=UPI0010805A12|nr:DUF3718 domain-containing protein [Thalassotalea sp. HSM 43]QBY04037.1 DUF3718 domain-containing protein [Thalassotalea sp. HSM 43]
MKITPLTLGSLLTTSLFCLNSMAANVTFVAKDNSIATKLCVHAVSNNLSATKTYLRRVAGNVVRDQGAQVHLATEQIKCNNTNLVEFTAQYGADNTFNYLNRRASSKYRIDNNVEIIDLSKTLAPNTVIVVSAN